MKRPLWTLTLLALLSCDTHTSDPCDLLECPTDGGAVPPVDYAVELQRLLGRLRDGGHLRPRSDARCALDRDAGAE